MVGSLFGTSCVPVVRFAEPPPSTFSLSCPLSFSVSLSITQPVVLRLSLLTDDFKPHPILCLSPQYPIHLNHSTTYRFESICIEESSDKLAIVDSESAADIRKDSSEVSGDGSEDRQSASYKGQVAVRIMVEACAPTASSTLVSDTMLADNDPIVVVEISHQVVRKQCETVWVLLNKEPTWLNVVLSTDGVPQPIDGVKLYGKLVIFTVPNVKGARVSQMKVAPDETESSDTANGLNGSQTNEIENDDHMEEADQKTSEDDQSEALGNVTTQTQSLQDGQPSTNDPLNPCESETLQCLSEVNAADNADETAQHCTAVTLECYKQQLVLPLTFQFDQTGDCEGCDAQERSLQISALFNFAQGGDPLALLSPLSPLISECDSDGCNALHLASRNKQNFALRTLLTAMHESCTDDEAFAILNARNHRGQTALHCAVRAGDADCVHYLLSAGALNRIPDNNLCTVIHYLGEVYNEAIYKEILEQSQPQGDATDDNGERVNPLAIKNADGYTAAHIAVHKLKLGLLEALIEVGAPLDLADNHGETPLISAVLMDDLDTSSLLLSNGCNANAVSEEKDTALGIACRRKNLVLIGRLLDAGADVLLPDKYGKPPTECEEEDVQRILHGERIEEPSIDASNAESPSTATGAEHDEDQDDPILRYRMRAINPDDISCLDYLTRLRMAKLLDADEKWIMLAQHLGCGHMVEFIRVCTDDASSPTMILLDQYEQIPNANLLTVTQALEDMGETVGVRLLKSGNEQQ